MIKNLSKEFKIRNGREWIKWNEGEKNFARQPDLKATSNMLMIDEFLLLTRRPRVAIREYVLDLSALAKVGLFNGPLVRHSD